MYVPAFGSWNTAFPRKFPVIRKSAVQAKPRPPLKVNDRRITLLRYPTFSSLLALETTGSSNTDKEPVRAVGKKINGNAIPFKIP